MEGCTLITRFRRLYKLSENKFASVSDMYSLGWGVDREAWEEDQVRECNDMINGLEDRWV